MMISNVEFMKVPLIIAFLGLIAALVFSLVVFPIIKQPLNLSTDPDKYSELAYNIYSGKGYKYLGSSIEAFDKAPIYPYLLALIYYLSDGNHLTIVQIAQAMFHALTSLLVFFFVRRRFSYKAAVIAQFIVALHPILIWYTARIWIESVYIFLFTFTCIYYIKLFESISLKNSIITGILNALTILTKSTILFLPLILMIPFYLKKGFKSVFSLFVVFLVTVLIISPWIWRNYRLSDSHIFIHATLGQNLIYGNSLADNWLKRPLSNLGSWSDGNEQIQLILKNEDISFEDPIADKVLINYHLDRIISNPDFLIFRTIINFFTFWYLSESPAKSLFFLLLQIPLLIIFILSLITIKKFDFSRIIIFIILYYSVLHALIIGWGRYSVALIPILIFIASIGFERVLSKFGFFDRYLIDRI